MIFYIFIVYLSDFRISNFIKGEFQYFLYLKSLLKFLCHNTIEVLIIDVPSLIVVSNRPTEFNWRGKEILLLFKTFTLSQNS